MKPINKDELYDHLTGFLKSRGVELREGSYAKSVQAGCTLLADTINLGHEGLQRAKLEMDKRLDQMRQTLHEKTAPKPAAKTAETPPKPAPGPIPRKARARKHSKPAKKR